MASISRAAISIKKVHQRQPQKSKPYAKFSKMQNNNKFTNFSIPTFRYFSQKKSLKKSTSQQVNGSTSSSIPPR